MVAAVTALLLCLLAFGALGIALHTIGVVVDLIFKKEESCNLWGR
jgi:hypothetical protein